MATVEAAGLDDGDAGDDLETGEEAGAAVAAEEVLVDLARGAGDVVLLGGSWGCQRDGCAGIEGGLPWVTLNESVGTPALEVKAEPDHCGNLAWPWSLMERRREGENAPFDSRCSGKGR